MMEERYKQAYIEVQRDRSKLQKQNKRYREALEKISRGEITYADSFGMINIARKALEESE